MNQVFLTCFLVLAVLRPAAAADKHPMQFVDVGGRAVAYHVLGNARGAPLLFINGGPGYDHTFHHLSPVWEQLAAWRRVVFFDQPGTGQSWPVGPEDSVSIADVVESIDSIRRALNAPRLVLVGHSWGGYVAMAYAVRHPSRVDRLILVASTAPNIAATESLLFGALFPDIAVQRRGLRAENPEDVQKYIRLTLAMSFYSPEIRDRILGAMGRVSYNSRLEMLEKEAEGQDLTNDLKTLPMPVLVLTGRFDANAAPRVAWSLHQTIPQSKLVVFERSGHFPMLEEPDKFVSVVQDFLQATRAP